MATTAAVSPLELLPHEIFEMIASELDDTTALARLAQCSRNLRARAISPLYKPKSNRDRAMRWACARGPERLIDLVCSHGASISLVDPPPPRQRGRRRVAEADPIIPMPTLQLAFSKNKLDIFCYLINKGAHLPKSVDHITIEGFMDDLCSKNTNAVALQMFIEAGLGSQLTPPMRNFLLLSALLNAGRTTPKIPGDLIDKLLDGGADPNHVGFGSSRIGGMSTTATDYRFLVMPMRVEHLVSMSPLAASLCSGRLDLFRLLIKRNGRINHVHPRALASIIEFHPFEGYFPYHSPIYAAVRCLAKPHLRLQQDDAVKLVQHCLDHGADINAASALETYQRCLTPLNVFLFSLVRWDERAFQNLGFLLDRGAILGTRDGDDPDPPPAERYWPSRHESSWTGHEQEHTKMWGIQQPHHSLFVYLFSAPYFISLGSNKWLLEAAKLLVRHGAVRSRAAIVCLAKYDIGHQFPDASWYKKPDVGALVAAWSEFIDTVIENIAHETRWTLGNVDFAPGPSKSAHQEPESGVTLTEFLRVYTRNCSKSPKLNDANPTEDGYHPYYCGRLTLATVTRLVIAGAGWTAVDRQFRDDLHSRYGPKCPCHLAANTDLPQDGSRCKQRVEEGPQPVALTFKRKPEEESQEQDVWKKVRLGPT